MNESERASERRSGLRASLVAAGTLAVIYALSVGAMWLLGAAARFGWTVAGWVLG